MQPEVICNQLFGYFSQGLILIQNEKIILVNQSFSDIVGYAVDELLDLSVRQFYDLFQFQEDVPVLTDFQDFLSKAGESKIFETNFKRKNGETGCWRAKLSPITYEDQAAVLGIFSVLTDRIRDEEKQEADQNLLSATMDVLPVGVCLTDEQGYYRMMNDAYCAIYEYDRAEMLGQHYSVIMPPDQIALANAHYAQLLGGNVGIPVERKRQRKDGSIVYIEAANALVRAADGQKMVITTVRDITERKQAVEIIELRLRLMEYAAAHTLNELMQNALDEIGVLTRSPIGFFHFVDDDQNIISLQAWSTKTITEFCLVEGEQRHYPIEDAGVWVDCVRQLKPVIHNDYKSLAHRKGMPDGHAEVIRELVVPTIKEGRVVAILGVGNKPSDYDDQDVGLVSYISDLVWSIIEQKKANEQIKQLNAQLERLAMQDDLTNLMNRRAFFIQGEKEISRTKRLKTPLSLLILDVDSFKNVNDQYGHATGDLVLQHISNKIVENVRKMDMVARMGGEEFSVLLPNTSGEEAVRLAERVRQAVKQESCLHEGQMIELTVSIGVACYCEKTSSLEAMLKLADHSMYQAKNKGRDRVVFIE